MPPRDRPRRDQPSEKMLKTILSPEEARRAKVKQWTGLDFSANGLHVMSPNIFRMEFLTALYMNQNNLYEVPADIASLQNLEVLDLSHNRLAELPREIGQMRKLKEVLLFHNRITTLPFEMGNLFAMHTLGLHGNPLAEPFLTYSRQGTEHIMSHLLDGCPIPPQPPAREWQPPASRGRPAPASAEKLSVYCYNVLCDNYATRQLYGYCPIWALEWDYRKGQIIEDIIRNGSDLILLQEVETREFYSYFQPELLQKGYEGVFQNKSRARTMGEGAAERVDGCAVFWKTAVFEKQHEHVVEFERLGAAGAGLGGGGQAAADMLNRVMPKDNIAILLLLKHLPTGKPIVVSNSHLTWDPVYKDVKLIQAVMLTNEVSKFMKQHTDWPKTRVATICGGDFNSTPDSGVFEFMNTGSQGPLAKADLEGRNYTAFFESIGGLKHQLHLKSCYTSEMPYTNYTHDFTGIIDYIFCSADLLSPQAVLGPVDPKVMETYYGNPNPHFPSDHFSLVTQLAFL